MATYSYDRTSKVRTADGQTWTRRVNELQAQFLNEVLHEVAGILENEGFSHPKVSGNAVTATHSGAPDPGLSPASRQHGAGNFHLDLSWGKPNEMTGSVSYGSAHKNLKLLVTSVSPMQVASEAIFAHFHGVLP